MQRPSAALFSDIPFVYRQNSMFNSSARNAGGTSTASDSPLSNSGSGRKSTTQLLLEHDEMSSNFDAHVKRRQEIDLKFSLLGDEVRRICSRLKELSSASVRPGEISTVADPSLALVARLEGEMEVLVAESNMLKDLKSSLWARIGAVEDELRANQLGRRGSVTDPLDSDAVVEFHQECVECERELREEENKLLDTVTREETQQRSAEERSRRQQERLEGLRRQVAEEENACAAREKDLSRVSQALESRRSEKSEWERRLRAAQSGVDVDPALTRLQAQFAALQQELLMLDKVAVALRQSEKESLMDPTHATIAAKDRPRDETKALIWEATRPLRGVMSLRDTLLVLKANLVNLYEDLDEISAVVDGIQSEPPFQMYPAFSEQSNQWRQQKLYDAFHDAVAQMQTRQHEVDPLAAATLLRKIKYFVVVYDLFENHYDAVVSAIMLSDGKWVEAEQMLEATMVCRKTIAESRRAQLTRRKSAVAWPPIVAAASAGSSSGSPRGFNQSRRQTL